MNQTRKLLQKIVENARTGADACDQMLSCAKDVDLRNELMNERDVYQDFTRDAERALFDSGAQPHASSPMSRAGMWIDVKTNTLADDSAAHLATLAFVSPVDSNDCGIRHILHLIYECYSDCIE